MIHGRWCKSTTIFVQHPQINPALTQMYVQILNLPWSGGWSLIQLPHWFSQTHKSRWVQSFIIQIPWIIRKWRDVYSLRWSIHPLYPLNVSLNSFYDSMILQQKGGNHVDCLLLLFKFLPIQRVFHYHECLHFCFKSYWEAKLTMIPHSFHQYSPLIIKMQVLAPFSISLMTCAGIERIINGSIEWDLPINLSKALSMKVLLSCLLFWVDMQSE